MQASQAARTGSGLNTFGPGPLRTQSPMTGSTTHTSTGNMGLFGNSQDSQPVTGRAQGLNSKGGSLFGSGPGSGSGSGSGFGSGSSSGSLFQGGATYNPFGSSPFGSATTPNSGSFMSGAASSGNSNNPSSQPSPFSSSTSRNSQGQVKSTVPVTQPSNSPFR